MAANSSLEGLVKNIHSMLIEASEKEAETTPTPLAPRDIAFNMLDLEVEGFGSGDSGFANFAASSFAPAPFMINMVAATPSLGMPEAANRTPRGKLRMAGPTPKLAALAHPDVRPHFAPADELPIRPRKPTPKPLPAKIIAINAKRKGIGLRHEALDQRRAITRPRPAFLEPRISTITQLVEGLEYIFSPLPQTTPRQLDVAREGRHHDVQVWVRCVSQTLDLIVMDAQGSSDGERRSKVNQQQSELVNLLTKLNASVESSSSKALRDLFYEAATAAKFEGVLDKFLTLTQSVRVQQQIDEFIEEKEVWKTGR
jgi:hypothetical protein